MSSSWVTATTLEEEFSISSWSKWEAARPRSEPRAGARRPGDLARQRGLWCNVALEKLRQAAIAFAEMHEPRIFDLHIGRSRGCLNAMWGFRNIFTCDGTTFDKVCQVPQHWESATQQVLPNGGLMTQLWCGKAAQRANATTTLTNCPCKFASYAGQVCWATIC